jgi:integrase
MPTYLPKRKSKSSGEWRWPWRASFKGRKAYGTCPSAECRRTCARDAEIALRAGLDPGNKGLTLAQVVKEFDERYLPEIPDSAGLYRNHLVFWVEQLGKREMASITPKDLATCRDRLLRKPSRRAAGRTLSGMTVNRYLQTISSVFSWAARPEIGLVSVQNPAKLVTRQDEVERTRWLSRPVDVAEGDGLSELERLLAACSQSRSDVLYDLVVLLVCTACRVDELLSLRRTDVRIADACFTLRATETKTDEPGYVALEGLALEVMKTRIDAPAGGSPWVFPRLRTGRNGAKGGHLPSFPRSAWLVALRKAKIADFRPHDLRHTAMSWARMSGMSLPDLMGVSRHKDTRSVMRYAHMSAEHGRKGAAVVAATVTEVAAAVAESELVN